MRCCPWTCILADLGDLIRRRAVVGEEYYLDSRFEKGLKMTVTPVRTVSETGEDDKHIFSQCVNRSH